jgi:hypothetical protein
MVDHKTPKNKSKQYAGWIILGVLVSGLFCLVAIRVEPKRSEASPDIDTVDSGFTGTSSWTATRDSSFQNEPPRIGAICFSGSGGSIAYVGGKFAREGDIVDGFRIIKICPGKVEFEKGGRTTAAVVSAPQTSAKPQSNNSFRQQVGHESSANYQEQYRRIVSGDRRIPENGRHYGQIGGNSGSAYTGTGASGRQVFETTMIDGTVRRIRRGTIFKTTSKNIYEVVDAVILLELEVRPDVTVLTDGRSHTLFIEGVDKPLLCRKLNRGGVIEATVVNEFDGLRYGNIYKLSNGQIWEQTEFCIDICIYFRPEVTLWYDGVAFQLKVNDEDEAVTVRQLH